MSLNGRMLLILLLISPFYKNYAQNMDTQIENIKSQGREKVIEMAYTLLEEKHPKVELLPDDYEISVWANSQTVVVKFRRLIKYYPKDYDSNERTYNSLIYDVSVDFIAKHIKPFDDSFRIGRFHIPSKEEQEIIEFVKMHTGIPFKNSSYDHEINEGDGHYDIYNRLNGSFTNYKLDKTTGEMYDRNELNATPANMPESILNDKDELKRIF